MQATLLLWRDLRRCARRLVASAAVGVALIATGQPAQALALHLDWALGFDYPPNPCIAGSALSTTGFGLYGVDAANPDGYLLWMANPGPPEIACGAGALSGSAVFDAADGTAIYGAWAGAVQMPIGGPPDMLAYAFPVDTAEGDLLVESDPGAAPLLSLCNVVVGSLECLAPGPSDMPLFAFASPGQRVGTLTLLLTPVPEPASAALLLSGLAALGALRRRRLLRLRMVSPRATGSTGPRRSRCRRPQPT